MLQHLGRQKELRSRYRNFPEESQERSQSGARFIYNCRDRSNGSSTCSFKVQTHRLACFADLESRAVDSLTISEWLVIAYRLGLRLAVTTDSKGSKLSSIHG